MAKSKVESPDYFSDVLYKMMLIRRFEEQASEYYRKGYIHGFCHLYIGQEAVACGAYSAIEKQDYVITSYRSHAHTILSGANIKKVMAELFGKSTGLSKGKGGSMHLFNPKGNFYGGHGIVAAQVPIGTGIAFGSKYREEDAVTVVFFGDGACNQGQTSESFNMAKLWNLPVVYVIENNQYAMGTSVERCAGNIDLFKRGEAFGVPGIQVDGMDFFAVRDAMKLAIKIARSDRGPRLIEVKTYRYRGHSMSDPARYRSRAEVDAYRNKKDPILRMKLKLSEDKIMTEEDFKTLEKRVKAEVEEAVQYAIDSPIPEIKDLFSDVFPQEETRV